MSDATKAMRDFLAKSPSAVFPDEVLELFIPVERENETLRMDFELYRELYHMAYNPSHYMEVKAENAKLRKLVQSLWFALRYSGMNPDGVTGSGFARQMRELGIEVR